MQQPPLDPLISISAAATRLSINRSTLSRQIKAGAVRAYGQKVRFSEVLADRAANIDLTRSGRHEGRAEHEEQPRPAGRASTRASADATPDATPDATDDLDDAEAADELVIVDGQTMPFAKARALKETYLARLRELEFRVKSGAVVDRAGAEAQFFGLARENRDAWMAWPARIAVSAAEDIRIDPATGKVDFRSLTAVLSAQVHQHLSEMGEPEAPQWPAGR